MQGDAERAVGQATTFLEQLLEENARSDLADVQLLCKRKPESPEVFARMACATASEDASYARSAVESIVFSFHGYSDGIRYQRWHPTANFFVYADSTLTVAAMWFFEASPHRTA